MCRLCRLCLIEIMRCGCVGLALGAQSQPMDNEAVACNWLQSQYECQPGSASTVTKTELYKHYVSACSVCGLQQIVSPTTFATCVRYDTWLCC